MPINSFRNNVAPAAGSLLAAYRPIVFQPQYSSQYLPFPPVVYCDVYFNNTYYRTLTSTSGQGATMFVGPYWIFDIQVLAQEYLQANLYLLNAMITPTISDYLGVQSSTVSCYCKFRVSSTDANGFIVPEGSPGVGGYQSLTFYVANAVLQHEDLQDLGQHAALLKKVPNSTAAIDFLPMTHRINYDIVCKNDYDKFPVFAKSGTPYSGVGDPTFLLRMVYKSDDGVTHTVNTQFNYTFPVLNIVYTIPSSIRLLKTLTWFTLAYPVFTPVVVDWDSITEYYLQLMLSQGAPPTVNFTSIIFKAGGCNCSKGRIRIRFLNYFGQWDSANFSEVNGTLVTNSDQWQKALKYPLAKSDGGTKKFNSSSNEEFNVSTCAYGEEFQEWLKELFDSPQAYIEIESIQGQPDALIPIVIANGKFTIRKNEGRYEYVTELTFTMANENIRQRN